MSKLASTLLVRAPFGEIGARETSRFLEPDLWLTSWDFL
jgi:hypothetical protein